MGRDNQIQLTHPVYLLTVPLILFVQLHFSLQLEMILFNKKLKKDNCDNIYNMSDKTNLLISSFFLLLLSE